MQCRAPLLAISISIASSAAADRTEVDLELLLMVDVSRSMTPDELEIQRHGYAAALHSDHVYAAVQSGLLRRVAMSYVEWGDTQKEIVGWRLLETREDLGAFAQTLASGISAAQRRTSISAALDFGAQSIGANGYDGLRKVIDVSGDGPNNDGRLVTAARDAALAQGIVINGLPIMTGSWTGHEWHFEDLALYYESCVTGGPGSFMIPVADWNAFAGAVRRKLVLEMASRPERDDVIVPAHHRRPYDCLAGETRQRRRQLDSGP